MGGLGRGAPARAPLRRPRRRAVLGWVAVSPVSGRCVYAGVVENSVYVGADARGRGVGRALLEALVASTEAAGIWTIQTGDLPRERRERRACTSAAGFRVVGRRERIGQLERRLARRAPPRAPQRRGGLALLTGRDLVR